MKTIFRKWWQTLLLCGLVSLAVTASAETLLDFKGKPHSLSEYTGKGKWTIVMFWASDCHVCNVEAHQYVDFHFAHADSDATVLGISLDGQQKKKDAEAFISRHQVNFPNLIAEPEDVMDLFGRLTGSPFMGTPTFLIYEPGGKLLAQQAGAVPAELIAEFIRTQTEGAKTPG